MTKLGEPYDPADPEDENSIVIMHPIKPLLKYADTSRGVQVADREGVYAQSFKCRNCTLHFVLFSWSATRHTPATIACPECGQTGDFMHRITQLSESREFRVSPDRQPEIYDVWPFRVG